MERFRRMRPRQPRREAAWVAASKSIKGVKWQPGLTADTAAVGGLIGRGDHCADCDGF